MWRDSQLRKKEERIPEVFFGFTPLVPEQPNMIHGIIGILSVN